MFLQRLHHRFTRFGKVKVEPKTADTSVERTYYCATVQTEGKPFKLLLSRPGFVEDKIARGKPWEENLVSIICFFMRADGVYLDIGANIGYFCFHVARSLDTSLSIAFEPHPLLYAQLLENLRFNSDLSSNICVHNAAVGDVTGETEFHMQRLSSYNRGLSSVLPNADLRGEYEAIKTKMVTLDTVLDDTHKGRIAVMKIDVQGYELQVIAGAMETIAKSKPIIIFEFEANYHGSKAAAAFDSIVTRLADYRIFLIKEKSPEFFAEFDRSKVSKEGFEGNFICFPHGRLNC